MGNSGKIITELTDDDKIFVSHIRDMAKICEKTYKPRFSAFLDERRIIIAEEIMNGLHVSDFRFSGGYENASRKVLGIFPEYCSDEEKFPITALAFRYRETDRLSHRDFLGAFMSKQIKREMLGDIVVSDGYTVVFVYDTVSDMLLSEVDKIGSVGVKVTVTDPTEITAKQSFIEKNVTVSSLRLDCIVSAAAGISRGKAADLIKGGYVSVMYVTADSASKNLSEGDIFSVRGSGKFLLDSVNGITKKDRIHITLKKYN